MLRRIYESWQRAQKKVWDFFLKGEAHFFKHKQTIKKP